MSSDAWISETTPYLAPRERGQSDAWSDQASRRGRRGNQRLLEVAEVDPPEGVRLALQLADGERAVVRRRLILLDEEPVELADSYYPAGIARGTRLADPRKVPGGAVTLLADLGYTGSTVVEDVSADLATQDELDHLALPEGSPVLHLMRTTLTKSGEPMEVSVMTMPNQRHLTYRLERKAC
ncbi:GntR family transcriptional regulator [Streptomyces sp. NPDC056527]|uniref:GntR family transcriptional regulator n=1 Tax=Streptomyces sp. NPDC056527 TaxID=3345853 RepID=UPI0036C876DB